MCDVSYMQPSSAVSCSESDRSAAPFIERILEQYEAAGLIYCILRNYQQLPDRHGNDIDILVARHHLRQGEVLLNEIAGSLGWTVIGRVRKYGYAGLYFCPPGGIGRWLTVDLITCIHFRGLSYVSSSRILRKRLRFKDFCVASLGSEGAILLLKDLLQYGRAPSKQSTRNRIRYCIGNDGDEFQAFLTSYLGRNNALALVTAGKDGNWECVEQLSGRIRRCLVLTSIGKSPLRQFCRWLAYMTGYVAHGVRPPLGLFIVVLGPDGCGKTTIAKHVGQAWQQTVPPGKEPEYIHGDFNNLPRLRGIRRLWAKMRGRPLPPEPDYTKKHAGAEVVPHSLLKSLLYLGYYFWGYVLGHAKVQRIKAQDRILIADRYFYDYFFQRGNMRLPHWLLRFLTWFIPKPDLTVVLNADTEAIYARKQELTVEEIDRQQAVIRRICRWLPNVIEVRTDQDIESTVAEVKVAMTDRLLSK